LTLADFEHLTGSYFYCSGNILNLDTVDRNAAVFDQALRLAT